MSLGAGATVFTADRRALHLVKLLKSGGAGSVYPLRELGASIAKIYHDNADLAEYERKVAAMLELTPNLPDLEEGGRRFVQIAWPQALLRDAGGRFVGFTMPLIDVQATSELECILQERQARAEGLPTGLGAKVTLAANLAAVIAELHRQGHRIIDLKPVNLRFYRQSLYMAMLDCDGFSIQGRGERFAAQQVTPDYLAPEFQNQPIPEILEEQQDRFALAVVIFQLLNFGLHPYTGRPLGEAVPTDIPGRIARRCYAYGLRANPNLQPSPVSGHAAMPSDLRALFDRAFENAGAARPGAAEWASALRVYAQRSSQRLVACAKEREHQHFAGLPCAACARATLIANTARQRAAAKSVWAMPLPQIARTAASTVVPMPRIAPAARRPASTAALPPNASALLAALAQAQRQQVSTPRRAARSSILVLVPILVVYLVIFVFAQLGANRQPLPPAMPAPTPAPTPQPYVPPSSPRLPWEADAVPAASAKPVDPGDVRAAIDTLSQAMLSGDLRRVRLAAAGLNRIGRQVQAQNPRAGGDSMDAYEMGRSLLRQHIRSDARDEFHGAIGKDPGNAQAWYGLGIATEEAEAATAAFAVAEALAATPADAELMRADFPLDLLHDAGIDPRRVAARDARARKLAANVPRTVLVGGSQNGAPGQDDLELTAQRARAMALAIREDQPAAWPQAMANLREIAAPAPERGNDLKASFDQIVAKAISGQADPAEQARAAAELEQALQATPRNANVAYELGWLRLADGQKDAARALFVRAIWCDPVHARAWFGLGVTAPDDLESEGALLMAESIFHDPTLASDLRGSFTSSMLHRNGIDPDRLKILWARALRHAQVRRGESVNPSLDVMANQALAPR